jgi:hemerythrin
MQQIRWNDKYNLGFDMIDSQHQEIFRLFDKVDEKLAKREYENMVTDIVDFLDEYIIYHFSQEEEFQEFIEYPKFEEHKSYHQKFRAEFERYKLSITGEGPPMNAIKGLNMLSDWLVEHILKEDYKLVKYIRENNY